MGDLFNQMHKKMGSAPGKGGVGQKQPPAQAPADGPSVLPMPSNPAEGTPVPNPDPAPSVNPDQNNIYNQSANAYNEAMQRVLGAGNISDYMSQYQNPYQQQVIDQTMNDMERQRQMMQSSNAANAANAGAFGGSRHGVVEAETNAGVNRNMAMQAANLRNQGFNTSAQLGQGHFNNIMQQATGLSGLSNQGFGMGNTLTDRQMRNAQGMNAINQGLMDQSQQQYMQYLNQPGQSYNMLLQALGGSPLTGNMTKSGSTTTPGPGFGDFLGLGLQAASLIPGVGAPAAAAGAGKK